MEEHMRRQASVTGSVLWGLGGVEICAIVCAVLLSLGLWREKKKKEQPGYDSDDEYEAEMERLETTTTTAGPTKLRFD